MIRQSACLGSITKRLGNAINMPTKLNFIAPTATPVPPEDRPSVRAMKGETMKGEDYRLKVPGGDYFVRVFIEQLPKMFDRPASALIMFQDISKLKTTESELRTVQSRLLEAIEIAQIGFWAVSLYPLLAA